MKLKTVLRDIVIIIFLTVVGGLIVGLMSMHTASTKLNEPLIGLANMIAGIIGFAVSYYLADSENRWEHLFLVAGGVWLVSLVNIPFGFATVMSWIFAAVPILIMMAVGSGIGFLIEKYWKRRLVV